MSFTHFFPTCGRMPSPAMSLWSGRQPYRPLIVDGRRGGVPLYIAPSLDHRFRTAHPCAQSVYSSPREPFLSRSSRQRLAHLQSHFGGGWHVCQAALPEPQSAAARRQVERRRCAHEALPRLKSASSWSVMEQNFIMMSGGALPASRYTLSKFVGWRQPEMIRHQSCRAGFSLRACVDFIHTGQAYSAA